MIPARIDWLGCDVDGVLTPNRLTFAAGADPEKTFDVRDGHGIVMLKRAGVTVVWVTGRDDAATHARAAELSVAVHVVRGDKGAVVRELLDTAGVEPAATAFVGDDLPDLSALAQVAWPLAPRDAHPAVRGAARRVTRAVGGAGAVREIADWILARR